MAEESKKQREIAKAEQVTIETEEASEEAKEPDAILQLVQCFQRAATSEEKQAVQIYDDKLYIAYADVMARSIHVEEEGGEGEVEVDAVVSLSKD